MNDEKTNNENILNPDDNGEQPKNTTVAKRDQKGFSLSPSNLKEALKICEYLANSSLVPKQYQGKPADVLVCINWGMEVGLKPLQALNNIAVINGNPSMWGAAPLALVRRSPDFEFILEDNEAFAYARDNVKGWEHLKEVQPNDTSICVVKRKGEPPLVREFSVKDVENAKLGNVHKTYPKDMRKYRARSRALEAAFGDVLKGIRQAELEKENRKMMDEGYYEDFDEIIQPEERLKIDIEPNNETDEEQSTQEPESDIDEEIESEGLPFQR